MTPTEDIWRRIVPPLVAAFAVFLAIVRVALRSAAQGDVPAPAPWLAFWRYLATTAAAGYLVFLGIVLVFHVVLAHDSAALASAVWGGAALLAIVLPLFALAEWVVRRSGR